MDQREQSACRLAHFWDRIARPGAPPIEAESVSGPCAEESVSELHRLRQGFGVQVRQGTRQVAQD